MNSRFTNSYPDANRNFFSSSMLLAVSALIVGSILIALFSGKRTSAPAPSVLLLSPPENFRYLSLGYNESISDLLWLRVIQDFDICEQVGKSLTPVLSSFKTLPTAPVQRLKCNRGWPFRMLLAITELSPLFRMPYTAGAITLSVLGEDREGATTLFEKGLKIMPDDGALAYKAAYHYMYEEKNYKRASELLMTAGNNGAPRWVYGLAARLMSIDGRMELAESVMKDQIENARNDAERKSFESKLEDIRSSFKSAK